MSIPKTLLVVKNRAMGDSVMTLATIHYLRDRLPGTKIIYGVPKWIVPLYANVQTHADEIIPLDFSSLSNTLKMKQVLKAKKIDTVLELFQSGRTSKFFKIWSFLGGPRYHFHNHHTQKGNVHDQGVIKSNIQRDLDAAWTYFGGGQFPPSFLGYAPQIKVEGIDKESNLVILGVVATRPTKMWPLENYVALTKLLEEAGKKVIIPLGPGDNEIEDYLKGKIATSASIIKAPLKELPLALAPAAQYIGNDTGLKHICVALGIPTFTLFGPEPPTEWHPYDPLLHPYYFRTPLECRTKTAHYCGLHSCESMICLNEFSPVQLMERLKL